jgi:hypothetical protein
MLGLVGGNQQCLCARVEVMGVGVEHDLAHQLAELGGARFEGEQRPESFGEAAGLRRLATGFTAFEDDEATAMAHQACSTISSSDNSSLRSMMIRRRSPARNDHHDNDAASRMMRPASHSVKRTPGMIDVEPERGHTAVPPTIRQAVERLRDERTDRHRQQ